ncbi:alpha/beta-hydrolase family protein [Nocardia sp. NPDC059180]|uniref:alpha/beta-hydrolase family protein n=1 Tax=Nocardia sp. NPDC059180 TaxID=3346761 RepID=UPI0036764290
MSDPTTINGRDTDHPALMACPATRQKPAPTMRMPGHAPTDVGVRLRDPDEWREHALAEGPMRDSNDAVVHQNSLVLLGRPSARTRHSRPDAGRHRRDRSQRARVLAGRLRESVLAPQAGTTVAIGIGVLMSLAPGLLPRTPMAQAVLTGLLVAAMLAIAGVARFVVRRCGIGWNRPNWRAPVLAVTALLMVGAAVHAGHWQNTLRAAMGTAPIGPGYWLRCGIGAVVIAGVLYGVARGIGWVVRALGRTRAIAAGVVVAAVLGFVGVPSAVDWRRGAYATANAVIDPSVVRPVSATRSGSEDSAVSWPSLGAEGRRFVSGAPRGPVRVYVGLASAPDLETRVALAVQELERSGGLQRSHVVIAVPTGSGWIDGNAIRGLDQRFGGDVALVGLQYSYAPSWVTFVFGREAAVASARALFTAVEQRIATLEVRPKLHVYGQSLGALGGSAIFTDDADQDRRTCSVLWAGPPAGEVHRAGATVLANTSDPVVHWSPSLLWRAPDLRGARADAPIPRWLPVVGFVQATADLLGALDAPPGHGHRYGADQGTALPDC